MALTARRRRLILLLVTGVPICAVLVLVLALWLWPNSMRGMVEGRLEAALGGVVTVGDLQWDDGALVLNNVLIHAPTLQGPAADILTIERMSVDVAPTAVLTSDALVKSVQIQRATLRVAGKKGAAEPQLNLSALRGEGDGPQGDALDALGGSSAGTSGAALPMIVVDDIELIVGLYDGARFEETGRARFEGSLEDTGDGRLRGDLRELGVPDGLALVAAGSPSTGSGDIRAQSLQLDARTQGLIPFPGIQAAVKALDLKGEVPLFTLRMEGARPVSAEMVVDDLSLRLDSNSFDLQEGQGFWAMLADGRMHPATEPPVMHVDGGRVELLNDRLQIQGLRGELVGPAGAELSVPWSVDLTIDNLQTMADASDDLDAVLARTPFQLRLMADTFTLRRGEPAVLPRRVARVLELFGVQAGTASVDLTAARSAPDAPLIVAGTVRINNAHGAYEQFPYPLDDLDADIDFDLDTVHVRSLSAHGRGGSTLSIEGEVEAQRGDHIDLGLQAIGVPLDAIFLGAMPDLAADALRDVLPMHRDVPSSDRPFAAGLSTSPGIDKADLDLRIKRERGEPVDISGRIAFEQLELEWHAFPWPVVLGRGWLDWADSQLHLRSAAGKGVTLHTPDGVPGHIEVDILLPSFDATHSSSHVEAAVRLQVKGQPLTGALHDAVFALTEEGGGLLQRTQLSGLVDLNADIQLNSAQRSTFTVDIDLERGQADISDLDSLGAVSLHELLDASHCAVAGSVKVTRDDVLLKGLVLEQDGRRLRLDGHAPGRGTLTAMGKALFLGGWVTGMLDEEQRVKADTVVHRWQPRGQFDLHATIDVDGALQAQVINASAQLTGLHPPVQLRQSSGTVSVQGGNVAFNDVTIDMTPLSPESMTLHLDGVVGSPGEALALTASDLDLASPLVGDLVPALAGDDIGAIWAALEPGGMVDLTARVEPGSWVMDVEPRTLAMTRGGRRAAVQVDRGNLQLTDVGMRIDDLNMHTPLLKRAVLDGTATWQGASIEGTFEADGALHGPLLSVLAGDRVSDALQAIEFNDGPKSHLRHGRFVLHDVNARPVGAVRADIMVVDARLRAGIELDQVHSRMHLNVILRGADPALLDLEVLEGNATVGPVDIEGLTGHVKTNDAGLLQLHELSGDMAGGRVLVDGDVDTDTGEWKVAATVAGARLKAFAPQPQLADTADALPRAQGRVEASLRLGGVIDAPRRRRGDGMLRVVEGNLGPLPAVVAVQQLLHLSSPVVGAIDYAQVEYHVDGERVVLDDIVLEASSTGLSAFSMIGSGTLDWSTMHVDLRLRPRGGWVVLRELIGAMQDQLYEISVTGSLLKPEVDVVALPGLQGR